MARGKVTARSGATASTSARTTFELIAWRARTSLETDATGIIRSANQRARSLFGRGLGPSRPGLGPLRGKNLVLLVRP